MTRLITDLMLAAFVIALGIGVASTIIKRRYRRMSEPAVKPQHGADEDTPRKLLIGTSETKPAISLEIIDGMPIDYANAKPVELPAQTISRLSPLLQGFPTAVLSGMSGSPKLMVVEIAGPLTEAANVPGGYRAFSMGAKGIREHATLFKPEVLQTAAGAATAWQLASMVVAQKHLAEISARLNEIKVEIANISSFLGEERHAQITGAYGYFRQVFGPLANGEHDPAVRQQIEHHEANLIKVQEHLFEEFERRSQAKVTSNEWFGIRDTAQAIQKNLDDLANIATTLMLCIRIRVSGWLMLSLFPGNHKLKDARRQDILQAIEIVTSKMPDLSSNFEEEMDKIHSFWKTEEARISRLNLRQRRKKIINFVDTGAEDGRELIRTCEATVQKYLKPSRVYLEIQDGQIVGSRQMAQHSAPT
ncbi:hypothetical protein [Ferrovum sp.]|uniref:hypothetical protein n=1 Tax=Ferrovum sp. TaxID=2609467 RepID=UPI00262118DE|nr:hypothetical protein [Ferrovum sp.]